MSHVVKNKQEKELLESSAYHEHQMPPVLTKTEKTNFLITFFNWVTLTEVLPVFLDPQHALR